MWLARHADFIGTSLLLLVVIIGLPVFAQTAENESEDAKIALEPCRLEGFGGFSKLKAQCGTFAVPLDYAQPDGAHIDLFVARIPALARTPAPYAFTFIAGGPGQASTEGYVSLRGAFELIRREQDVILVDQRGTGQSHQQQCDLPDDYDNNDPDNWSAEEFQKVARQCTEKLTDDVRFYTTSAAVRDLDAVRAALGYSQLNVYGVSYGSRVAQHYLRRFPDHTRTVIIDGVVPVNLSLGPGIAIDAQRALDIVFDRCNSDEACRSSFGDIRSKFENLAAKVKETPVNITIRDPINGRPQEATFGYGELLIATRLMSYSTDMVSLLPLMIDAADQGNYQPLAAQALLSTENLEEMLAYGMHNTIVCTEDVPYFDVSESDQEAVEKSYIGSVSYKGLVESCKVWPAGPIDADFKEAFSSDTPVLVLSGEADPVTPPAYGQIAADYLGNALHLVVDGQGHGQAPISCVPRLMSDFVSSASLENLDIDCLQVQDASPFFTSFSGPEP